MEKMAHFFSFKTPEKIGLGKPSTHDLTARLDSAKRVGAFGHFTLRPSLSPRSNEQGIRVLGKESIAVILILLLGFFLRIYRIKDYVVFLGDEGRDVLVVYNILHGDLTLLGPTSSVGGFFLGPIYYYFMAPFLFLSRYDPVGPAIMVALFGLVTIYLVYKIGKEFFGREAGLIASLLYAISPIVIIYSRSSWNPNVFPFFTLSSLYVLYKAVSKNSLRLFFLAGILMGINLQIHYLATFVGGVMFFYVLFVGLRPEAAWFIQTIKRYLLMLVGFVIGFSPFLAFELRHQFTNTQNIINFIFNSPEAGASGQFFSNLQHVFIRLFGGLVLSFPTSNNFFKFDSFIQVWLVASAFLGLVSVIFFLIVFIKSRTDKKLFQKYLLIFLWGLLGIGLFGLYKKSIYDYYLGFLFPLPFLLVGFLFSEIGIVLKKPGKVLILLLVGAIVFVNLKFSPINVPGNHQVEQVKMISDFVLSKTNGQPYNFSISGIGNSDHAYRYFFKLAGRDPVVILGIDKDPKRTTVTSQLFVVCETNPCALLGESRQEIAGFGRAEIEGSWDVSVIKVYKLVHYKGK